MSENLISPVSSRLSIGGRLEYGILREWLESYPEIQQDDKFWDLSAELLSQWPREQRVFQERFREGKLLRKIAEGLGVTSRERPRQLSQRALRRLSHQSTVRIFIEHGYTLGLSEGEIAYVMQATEPLPPPPEPPPEPKVEVDPEALVQNLEIGVRAWNCLSRAGIVKVAELIEGWSERDLMQLQHFGRKTLFDLRQALEYHGFPPLRR